jgi:hypothetical protein
MPKAKETERPKARKKYLRIIGAEKRMLRGVF